MILIGFLLQQVSAQNEREEYFKISNHGNELIWVHLRANGRGTVDTQWQRAVPVRPGETGAIRLRGYEPFDIIIEKPDGTAFVAWSQPICSVMRECARTRIWDWEMYFRHGQFQRDRTLREEGAYIPFDIVADEDELMLPYGVIKTVNDRDPPRLPRVGDPPPPPRPKKK